METYEEDRENIHNMIGLPYKKVRQFHDMKDITEAKNTTQDWTRMFFEKLSPKTKQQLRDIYKYDFEMFDYDKFLY